MNPARARTLANRWFATGVTALILRTALAAVGIDEFDLPITVGMWLAFMQAVGCQQWARGYEAHAKTLEDA